MTTPYVTKSDRVTLKGCAEDTFWRIAREADRWWTLFARRRPTLSLPKRTVLAGFTIGHYKYVEAVALIPASLWNRDTALQVAVWNEDGPKRTGYLTYDASDGRFRFSETKPS